MANPSSTSSKRLVGLGLRGMRNSIQAPPTQVAAQIKSALAQSSPRTSPTVTFTPTATTTATPGGLTRTVTTSPSATSMRTSPSMVTITSFTHPNAVQHPGIAGGNATMTRTPTSPIGMKTFGGGSATTTTSPTLLSRTATTTSPFGTPTSTPFVTPNTSPQMLMTVTGQVGNVVGSGAGVGGVVGGGGGGNLVVENGGVVPVGANQRVPLTNTSARSVKSPYEFRNTGDGYFGPMKRLEEIVNEISEEMREGGREGEGSSPHTEDAKNQSVPLSPELQGSPMFFDVPFPLHPEKTFRIHSSPTTGNELITNGKPHIDSGTGSTIPRSSSLTQASSGRVVSNATTVSGSPAPSSGGKSVRILSTDKATTSPKTSANTRSGNFFQRFISSAIGPSSSSTRSTTPKKIRFSPSPSPSSASYYSPIQPISSPRSSPGSNYSGMSGGNSSDYRSFSTSSPLATKSKSHGMEQLVSSPPPSPSASLSRWLREGGEENYSTMCSPSSSPLLSGDGGDGGGGGGGCRLISRTASVASSAASRNGSGVGLRSYSSVESLSPRKRSGFNSPVAKIETVLGPRERGVGCIPEKRDYYPLYSRLRSGSMSPGLLTPLEENESMDFNFGVEDQIRNAADTEPIRYDTPAPSPISPSPSSSPPVPPPISGMPVVTSSDTVVVANAAVGILSGAGTGAATVTATAPPPRLGLRRKSTGVGSPLVNVVATYDSVKDEQAKVDGGQGKQVEEKQEGEDDELGCGDTPMSPVLMRTKDSLLLKEAQKQKRKGKNAVDVGMMASSIMEKPEVGAPTSHVAPLNNSGKGWNTVSEELRFLVDTEMRTRSLGFRDVGEMQSSSPPFCSPESIYTTDNLAEYPPSPRPPAQVSIPDTPAIGPCTMTISGSRPVDEAISPLQLSSPILSSMACS